MIYLMYLLMGLWVLGVVIIIWAVVTDEYKRGAR